MTGLTPNCECIVTINGTEYRTTAIHDTYNAYEWYIIGNGDLVDEGGGDTSLPFGFFIDKYNENIGFLEEEFENTQYQYNKFYFAKGILDNKSNAEEYELIYTKS